MVTALLFARLREQAGTGMEKIKASGTVRDVYGVLRSLHPDLESNLDLIQVARNEEFAGWDEPIEDGDELAFIPPVSGGGAELMELREGKIDVQETDAAVAHPGAGAIVSFVGIVRDNNRGEGVTHLEYEAYAPMARKELEKIGEEIASNWPGARTAILHRTGRLEIGEASVVISVSAPRRAEAFDGCRYAIEKIKKSVPIWKKEFASSGEVWIEGPEARPVR